jgi:hypothetical protein
MAQIQPGDVLAVRGSGVTGELIRLGEALEGEPDIEAHVAVIHHVTGKTTWCIEGRPGGVGWRDARDYLKSGWTVSNAAQPKTPEQRKFACAAVLAALGTPYDWSAIAKDAADALRLGDLFASEQWGPRVPGHVVCSSLAAWGYMRAGLAYPRQHVMAEVTPGDWTEFIMGREWIAGM